MRFQSRHKVFNQFFHIYFCMAINPSHLDPSRREKINFNFYFFTSLCYIERTYEDIDRASGTGWLGTHAPTSRLFCVAVRKKGKKGKKERVSKQKLFKGYRQGQNVTVLAILEHLEFKNFPSRPTMVADNTFQCSIVPALWNAFRKPWFKAFIRPFQLIFLRMQVSLVVGLFLSIIGYLFELIFSS